MTGNERAGNRTLASTWTRAVLLALLCGGLALLAASSSLHAALLRLMGEAESVITHHPVGGPVLFFALAALSAMLAFFSSAVIVPVGVYAWGGLTCFMLLWGGWLVGGIGAYAIGRFLGRPVVATLVSADVLERYQQRISARAPFRLVLLFQLALPSEIPGYLLGLARYSLPKFAAALAIAELPFALGTVYLGASFLERRIPMLLALGALGIAFSVWAARRLRRHISS